MSSNCLRISQNIVQHTQGYIFYSAGFQLPIYRSCLAYLLFLFCGCPQESRPLHCYNALELYILCKAVLFLNNLIPLNIFLNRCPYLVWIATTSKKAKASQSFKSRPWIQLSLCLKLLLSSKKKKLDNNDTSCVQRLTRCFTQKSMTY